MAGPPMSICSTHSAGVPPAATVAANGYRLATSRSNGSIPSSARALTCAGWARSARSPACTAGCSVFTRPSNDSGNPVMSSTSVTGRPAALMVAAVEPVETSCTPAAASPAASSASPVLSYTLNSARRMGCLSLMYRHLPADHTPARPGQPADRVDEQPALDRLDPLVQLGLVGTVQYRHRGLGDDRAGVHSRVDQMHGNSGDLHAVVERVPDRVHAGERGLQGRMGVDGPVAELCQKR